jgi:uncharacterized membrane protein
MCPSSFKFCYFFKNQGLFFLYSNITHKYLMHMDKIPLKYQANVSFQQIRMDKTHSNTHHRNEK